MKRNIKTLVSSLFGITLILTSFNSEAIEDLDINIDENAQKVRMEVKNPINNEIDIYLFTSNDRMVFSDKAELDKTFESQVDFSEYRKGTYTLVSEIGNLRLNKVIKVKESNIELIDSYYSFTPVFRQEGDLLEVHFINTANAGIDISIEDNSSIYYSDIFFSEEDRTLYKMFSLENLRPGEYMFTLSTRDEVFNHTFEVE